MAQNEVKFTIRMNDDNTIDIISKKSKKAAAGIRDIDNATKQANKSRSSYNKQEKGVAGLTSNSTKAFAKQAQTLGGTLVPAYAVLAANIFAITAAFGALKRAAEVDQLITGFTMLGNEAGRSATVISSALRDVTGNAISMEQALRSSAAAFSAGFKTEELLKLGEIAKNASIALGRDMGDALDRLVRGVGKLEPEILDELGIFVKLDVAVQKYAAQLGKTGSSLTEAERRQAFLNESLTQGAIKFGFLTDKVEPTAFDQLAATFNDLTKSVIDFLNTALTPIASFLANNISALTGVLVIFGGTILRQMVPGLNDLAKGQAAAAAATAASANIQVQKGQQILATQRKIVAGAKGAGKNTIFGINQKSIADGTISTEKLKQSIVSLERIIRGKTNAVKKGTAEEIAAYNAEIETLKRAKAAADKLYASQTGNSPKQVATGLSVIAKAQGKLATATEDISNSSPLEGFTKANKAMDMYIKRLIIAGQKQGAFVRDAATGKFSFLNFGKTAKLGFTLASGGARLFGAALINAIPVIGQIIFVVGLLIETVVGFFQSTEKVQRPLDRLGEVTDTVGDKIDQFNQSVKELPQLLARAGSEMSGAAMDGLILQKQLKITAGVTDEFVATFKEFGTELANADLGILESLGSIVKEKFVTGFRAATEAVSNFASSVKENLTTALGDAWGWLQEKFPNATAAATAAVSSFTDTVTSAATGVGEAVSQGLDGIEEAGKYSKAINVARKEYEKLLQDGGFTARFLQEEFGSKGLAGAYQELQAQGYSFASAQKIVNDRLDAANRKAAEFNDQANGIGEKYSELTQTLSKFRASLAAKDEFQTLADNIYTQADALQTLFDNTELGEGRFDIIQAEIEKGTLNLKEFGISIEDIQKNGGKGVRELGDKFADVAEKQRLLKEQTKSLKEELAALKLQTDIDQATRELNASIKNLKEVGKFEVPMAKVFEEQKTIYDESLKLIDKEFDIKSTLVKLEYDLLDAKLAVQRAINAENPKVLAAIEKEQEVVNSARQAAQSKVEAEKTIATLRAQQKFYTDQEANQTKYMEKLKTGSLMERIQAMKEGGGFSAFSDKDTEGNIINENLSQQIEAAFAVVDPMVQKLKELGPEGEYIAAVVEGAQAFAMAWVTAAETVGGVIESLSERTGQNFDSISSAWSAMNLEEKATVVAAGLNALGSSVAALQQAFTMASRNRIAGVDKEIAAEKARDGQSAQSLEKIKQLEAKKEKLKKKEFETNKKLMLAQAIINTAAGIAGLLAIPFGLGIPLIPFVAALGAAQVALIAGMSYQGGGSVDAGAGGQPSAISVGKRQSSIDVAQSRSGAGELGYLRGEAGTGGPENFKATNAFAGMKYRANGGNTGIVVGEQGPELFIPDRPGKIVPSDEVQSGGTSNINFSINAIDAAGVEEVLIGQRGNIIGMIREAANTYGETFMEQVDTGQYTPSSAGARKY